MFRLLNIDTIFLGGSDKWHEVSRGLDRMVEFVSTELDKQQKNSNTDGKCNDTVGISCNTSPDSGIDLGNEQSSVSCSNPPPLHRPDSPPILDGPPRTPSPCSPSPPVLPYSPAPLDGPYSPVPSNSPPPTLQPSSIPVVSKYQRDERHFKDKFFHHKGKFRPKGKGWKWQQLQEAEAWY